MTAQKGKDLLLKLDADGAGFFQTVAGLRSRRIAFNTEAVDVTNTDSAGHWRELLAGAGVKRAGLTGAGLFKDDAALASVRALFFAALIRPWQAIIPGFGIVVGPFQIVSLDYGGQHDGEVTYEMALESAGELSFETLS